MANVVSAHSAFQSNQSDGETRLVATRTRVETARMACWLVKHLSCTSVQGIRRFVVQAQSPFLVQPLGSSAAWRWSLRFVGAGTGYVARPAASDTVAYDGDERPVRDGV